MKCARCGTGMVARRGKYLYEPVSGVQVYLKDVEVNRCEKCGEVEVTIPRIERLHRAIAFHIVNRHWRLSPGEIKYLRKYLGWSGSDFAAHMGVNNSTVSRWENERERIGPQADRLLRLMVITNEPVGEYPLENLKEIRERPARSTRPALQLREREWFTVTA